MTDLSIIVVCYKGWESLNHCLEALGSFSGKNMKCEVIVVDNKSDDDTIYNTQERFPMFRFIFNDINGGFGNGCNLGSRNSTGEFILFLNPDTIASESAVEKLLMTAKMHSEFSILSCRQVNETGRESIATGPFPSILNITGFMRAIFGSRPSAISVQDSAIGHPDWVSGSVLMIKRETFLRLNGFDEDFWMYFEDVDLCRRVRDINGEIAFCRNITVEHNHGGSSRINFKTTSITKTEVYISRHLYISKHYTGIIKLVIQTFMVINNLVSGGVMAVLGLILFFVPKVFLRTVIFIRMVRYYTGSLLRLSWLSSRSPNFRKA